MGCAGEETAESWQGIASQDHASALLVIDAADKIYMKDPDLLFDIQALAKDGADSGCLRVVFVFSETSAFEMLQSHSHASRSRKFLVGEIEDDEAVDCLVSKGINKENATDAVARITGGRFALLNDYIGDHQDGLTKDQVLANYHAATNSALAYGNRRCQRPFRRSFNRILESGWSRAIDRASQARAAHPREHPHR